MDNIFFNIISTQKFINTRQKHLKETWLKNIKNYIFASDIDNDDNIKLSDKHDHSSGEEKQINIFNYLLKNKKFDYYFFCDDDTFVNIKILNKYLLTFDQNNAGNILSRARDPLNPQWLTTPSLQYFSGGAGFILNREIVETIANNLFLRQDNRYGDVSLGIIMDKLNISLNHSDLFNKDTPENLKHDIKNIKNSLTYHYVRDDMMYKLHEDTL